MNHNSLFPVFLSTLLLGFLVACTNPAPGAATAPPTFVNGRYAYVPFANQLQVVDVADPRQPQSVGTPVTINGLFFQAQVGGGGDWLAASQYGGYDPVTGADTNSAILVFSLHDPQQPALVATLPLVQAPQAMLWHGRHLYAADWEQTAVYDMHQPAEPTLVTIWPERFDAFSAADDTLYASRADCNFRTGWCRSTLREISLNPPPAQPGALHEFEDFPIWRTQVNGDFLYVSGNQLTAVPRTQLADLPSFVDKNAAVYGSFLQQTGDRLYSTWGNTLIAYTTADPAHPQKLYEITAASADTYFMHMAIQDEHLYLVSQEGLHIYNLAGDEAYGVALLKLGP